MKRWARLVCALGVMTACASRAELRGDQISFSSPKELALVSAPFTLRWATHDRPPQAARYGVFVDRPPMKPGDSVRDLFGEQCRATPGCPDEMLLRTLGIYLTPNSEAVISTMPILGGVARRAAHPVHQVTVVYLDRRGRRVGGYAFTTSLRAAR
jgi:hypothetical protein